MANSPRWTPSPQLPSAILGLRAWVNGIAVILLVYGWNHLIYLVFLRFPGLIDWFYRLHWRISYILVLLLILSPIVLIAFLYHWLHKILDNLFPESALPDTETTPKTFPGLISWWKGLYGWVVYTLSTFVVSVVVIIFISESSLLSFIYSIANDGIIRNPIPFILQSISAAFLYQFEYLVHQRLIAAGRR